MSGTARNLLACVLAALAAWSMPAAEAPGEDESGGWYVGAAGGLLLPGCGNSLRRAAEVSVRAIVETALSQKAVSVILSHNHVDAYALPSREDEITTRRVRDALLLVGITLADHIIVCGEDYVSFADSGLL